MSITTSLHPQVADIEFHPLEAAPFTSLDDMAHYFTAMSST